MEQKHKMDVRLLCAVALVLSLGLSEAQYEVRACLEANARSCGACLQVPKPCGWCSDESFLRSGEAVSTRCDDLQTLMERGCPPGKIVNPHGDVNIEKNEPVTNHGKDSPERPTAEQIIQIQPQKLSLTLRLGEPQTFSLKFKRAEDYPIDLYYLMDLSSATKADLENVKNLGTALMMEMRKITSDFRIGFGSIVKTAAVPVGPDDPCRLNGNCSSPFSYRNVLALTDRGDEFIRLVGQQQISDITDSPEGGFNAIVQAAVCEEQVGWRNASRLLVVSTNGGFHFDGDGKLLPSVGQCQLENDTFTGDTQDSVAHPGQRQRNHRKTQTRTGTWTGTWGFPPTFPTARTLARTLMKHDIQTIFAVSENVLPIYKELKDFMPKSAVGTLSFNSSNVVELIVDAYNSLSSEVILENSQLPDGVYISFKSLCKNGVQRLGERGRKCSNISIGDEVSFEVSIGAQKCPEHGKAEVVKIKPLGFNEEVEVTLNFICECQCSAQGEPQSDKCYKAGTFECGACRCDPGRLGGRCECSADDLWTSDPDAQCRRDADAAVCSNNGDCVCGTCECRRRHIPTERYSGQFCECDNFNCDRSNNRLCGGHGRCECGKCICDANYTGSACDCSLDTTSCLASNGQICNGRGFCECGDCRCTDFKYQGRTCEMCPTCPGVCTINKDCVECRAYGKGQKRDSCESDCSYFTMIKVKDNSDLPQPWNQMYHTMHCKERDEDDCWYYFTHSILNGTQTVHAVEKKDCPSPAIFGSLW